MMTKIIYLLYIDILGFKDRAIEIANEKNINVSLVRKIFRLSFDDKINELKSIFDNIDIKKESDNYYISVAKKENYNAIDQCFEIIEILDTNNLGLNVKNDKNFYEIGLAKIEFNEPILNKLDDFINKNETLQVLKFPICKNYKKYYKKVFNDSIKQTFIVFTEDIYNELSNLDKKKCKSISFEKFPRIFSLELEVIIQIGKFNCFLRKTELSRTEYIEIYWLYEEPDNYDKLITILNNFKILILVGSFGLGKTYTAVKLLFDYFLKDYIPKCIKYTESPLKIVHIEDYIEDKSVIYIEDPLGKYSYRENELIEQNFDLLLADTKKYKNTYIIITIRDSIFSKSKLSKFPNVDNYVFMLTHSKKPYDNQNIKNMIVKYSNKFDCKWNSDENLKKKVQERALFLKTPLSISLFVDKTKNIVEFNEIVNQIDKCNEMDLNQLIKELNLLNKEYLIFLIKVLSSELPLKIEQIQKELMGFYKFLNLSQTIVDISEFFGEYIDILQWGEEIYFTHIFYKLGLEHLLFDKRPNDYYQIFIDILRYYNQNPLLSNNLSYCLFQYHFYIPQDLKEEIIKNLSDKEASYYYLYGLLTAELRELPENLQDLIFDNMKLNTLNAQNIADLILSNAYNLKEKHQNLIFDLIKNPEWNWGVIESLKLKSIFDNLPQNFRKKILESLIANYSRSISGLLIDHYLYGNLKDELRPIIQRIFDDNIDPKSILEFLFFRYQALDQILKDWFLKSLCKKPDLGKDILILIFDNFNEYGPYSFEILNFSISCKELAKYVLIIVEENYWDFEEHQRNELLLKLKCDPDKEDLIKKIIEKNEALKYFQ